MSLVAPALTPKGAVKQQVRYAALPPEQPMHYRSHTVAIILAALALAYLPLSLHNFYLGYYGRGVLAIALLASGLYLLLLSAVGLAFGSSSLLAISHVGIGVLAGWFCWQLSDLLRIIRWDLKPKNAAYKSRSPKK